MTGTPNPTEVSTVSLSKEVVEGLRALHLFLDGIDTRLPWQSLPELELARRKIRLLSERYRFVVSDLSQTLVTRTRPRSILTAEQAGLDAMLSETLAEMRERWREAQARLDATFAESLAWLSVWMGILSLVLAVLPFLKDLADRP